jgi:thioredoxin 1
MKKIFILSLLSAMVLSVCSSATDSTITKDKKPSIVKAAAKNSQTNPDTLKAKPAKPVRLVDLGANKCVPCKMMEPILENLRKDFAGRMEVEFIDIWKDPHQGNKYKIRVIPTQIFFSPDGKELFRHEGFYSREDILNKWKELGHDLN